MKCTVPEISWHNRDPVLSIDFQHTPNDDGVQRLATGGTDSHVLIWYVSRDETHGVNIEFACDLTRHQKAVNVVRFSPKENVLASADDEATIIVWKLGEKQDLFYDDSSENNENWIILKMLRGHVEDIYDLSWSSCGNHLISGSVDNTAIMWDVKKGKNIGLLNDHKGFVQGVAWDPLNNYIATLSSDRLCRLYNTSNKKVMHRIHKTAIPIPGSKETKISKLFHDDTLKTFCRRLTFSQDGELLITPAGLLDFDDGKTVNATYIFSRSNFNKPAVYLPTNNKYTIAVRCCPVLFKLRPIPKPDGEVIAEDDDAKPWQKYSTMFSLPYRTVFAVATQDSVLIYDTQQTIPLANVSNCHYTRLSDISWSKDGKILIMSSTDGYCSFLVFEDGELGTVYNAELPNIESQIKQPHEVSKTVAKEEVIPVTKEVVHVANKIQANFIKDKKGVKRVPFKTLSSPKNFKKNENENKPLDQTKSSEFLKNLQPSDIMEEPMELAEDPIDLKLILEPTVDEFSMQDVVSQNNKDKLDGMADGSKAPRRVQFITLSKPTTPR